MNDNRPRIVRPAAVLFLAASLLVAAAAAAVKPQKPRPERGGECLVLIDLDAFYCGLCLEALLSFCRAVPSAIQESQMRGILLGRPASSGRTDDDLARIARRKWDGFRRANDIRFPVLSDAGRVFRLSGKAGVAVVLLDDPGRAIRCYPLPLRKNELAAVLRFLGQ